jgi:hypothetical protein
MIAIQADQLAWKAQFDTTGSGSVRAYPYRWVRSVLIPLTQVLA